ncbi:MAG TPA: germacradienol/geosmin synthase [Actinophytocola sp.]|uniref:terpene synthase family protein n=1 Tax=Actinophytocola sp. TaxID=1872138 RepID=UPI002DDCDC74|nr:germacradienol/geosmin synthase [Actinophytocola sp.]HEV2783391.1 germacradienol/geosmin synthase [Actinophytocola sp.]
MQPFELPEFYLPQPARLNPNVDRAREHTKEWARQLGMLDPAEAPWDERGFGTMDYALLTSYTHPDAAGPELDLLTDWYVWAFYFDDDFLERYKRTGDPAGARTYVDGLAAFMPTDLETELPRPTNPVQRGLADLWFRTVPAMSAGWRHRFAETTRNMLGACLWELGNITERVVPNPIDYIAVRRKVGGAPWSAALVERAVGAEIPARLAGARPVRVLRDAFADAVHLRNDIFSYQRETESEGEINNAVLVIEQFFGYEPQQAAYLVNDIITARLRQFEHAATTVLGDYGLAPTVRADAQRYVDGLRDWQAGGHEWHLRSSRYMNTGRRAPAWPPRSGPVGMGTTAARIGSLLGRPGAGLLPASKALGRPEFYMPFASRSNPRLDATRAHATAWARSVGMLDGTVWAETWFEAMDFALLAALTRPDAPGPVLELVNDWHVWAAFVDDLVLAMFEQAADPADAKAFLDRLLTFAPENPAAMPVPDNPAERGLADVWSRISPNLSADLRPRLRDQLREFADHRLWRLTNIIQNRLPDPVDYVETRRAAASFAPTMAGYALGRQVPAEILDAPPMRALADTFRDVGPLRADIFRYDKEIGRDRGINNGVLVVQRFLGCGLDEAVKVINELVTGRLSRFERIVATELPALFDELGLDQAARHRVLGYVEGLQDWMAGELQWSQVTGRYRAAPSTPQVLGRLTRLGSAAPVRIALSSPAHHSPTASVSQLPAYPPTTTPR